MAQMTLDKEQKKAAVHQHEHEHCHADCCEHEHVHAHEHTHAHAAAGASSCSCCHCQETLLPTKQDGRCIPWYKEKEFYEIAAGAICFLVALPLPETVPFVRLGFLLLAYLLLGREIIFAAAKNIVRGKVFDENFLMTVATLGAFALGEYSEAVGIMLFFRIGEFFEEQAVSKSKREIAALLDLRPETVVCRDAHGNFSEQPAAAVKVGQVILIKPGERIPLDGKIIKGNTFLDTSPLTGEPLPRSVKKGDKLLSGCINKDGVIELQVEKPLADSMVSRIVAAVEGAAAQKPSIERFISRFARYYTPFVVISALILAIVPSLLTGNWWENIYISIAFLIISCPCALVLSVPLAFFSGIGAASRQGVLVKSGAVLESLAKIRTIAFDKTGTLTTGTFAVKQVIAKAPFTQAQVLQFCASAERSSTHPLAKSIVAAAEAQHIEFLMTESGREIAGHGLECVIAGKKICCGSSRFLQQQNIAVEESDSSAVYLAVEGHWAGTIELGDTLKLDAAAQLQGLHRHGFKMAMFTGDGEQGAQAIAAHLPLDAVRADLLPEDKLAALQQLRSQFGKVLFVGDGINDAPVLANADVGGAMGSGSDVAVEAADIVFLSSKLQAVADALRVAAATRDIAIQNVVLALGVKGLVMLCGVFGYASLWSAVFADTGVALLCVLNSMRLLYRH